MADNAIVLTEGDEVTYTITVKRAGTAEDLTGYTVVLYAHEHGVGFGTNQIDGSSCTLTDAANGVVTHAFTSTHTTFATNRDLEGVWALKLTDGSGNDEWTKQEPFYIRRNPFVAEGS